MFVLAICSIFAVDPNFGSELIFPRHAKHNHSSCIVECPNGDLLVCWYRGSGERTADDVRILGARKRKNESNWSEPFELADTVALPDCNPILHVDRRNRLWLFWPTILDNHWESALLKVRWSEDYQNAGPPKWSWQDVVHLKPEGLEPKLKELADSVPAAFLKLRPRFEKEFEEWKRRTGDKLYQRLGWMPRVHVLELASGEMLLPLYCDTFSIGLCAITSDHGQTWQASGPMIGFAGIQPALIQKKNGEIAAYQRNNGWGGKVLVCSSKDNGRTWSNNQLSKIPNPGSSVDVVALGNGDWLMICNDTARGRHRISCWTSKDEGKNWAFARTLEDWRSDKGSASYPSVIQTRDQKIHVTYTYEDSEPGKSIKHVWFDPAWLTQPESAIKN